MVHSLHHLNHNHWNLNGQLHQSRSSYNHFGCYNKSYFDLTGGKIQIQVGSSSRPHFWHEKNFTQIKITMTQYISYKSVFLFYIFRVTFSFITENI